MNINELAGVHNANIDNVTGKEISHEEKYQRVISKLGYEELKHCVPFTLEQIQKALPLDKHLNNLALIKWDAVSGVWVDNQSGRRGVQEYAHIVKIYKRAGVTSFSQSDGVCILKETARLWAKEAL